MTSSAAPTGLRALPWRRVVADDLGLLLTLPLWLWWAAVDGGYPVTVFAGGLLYLVAAAGLLAVSRPPVLPRGPALVALLALAGLAVLAFCSILWADDRGLAWTSASRLTLYALAVALPLLWPPSARGLLVGVAGLGCASLVGLVAGVGAGFGDRLALDDGRLTSPTDYPNATAALLAIGALALLPLAVAPARERWLRAVSLGACGMLAAASLLAQSRAGLAMLVAAAALAVATGPRRGAVLAAVAAIAVATLAGSPVLLDVRSDALEGDADGALTAAVAVLVGVGIVLAAVGWLLGRADEVVVTVGPRLRAGAVAAAAVLIVGALAFGGAGWIGDRLDSIGTPNYEELEAGETRFSGDLGSNRPDYWEASLETLADHPAAGVGAGGFAEAYLRRRETGMTPLYAHSAWLQAAADLGLPGLLLLALAAGGLALALLGAWRRVEPSRRHLVAGAALPAAYVALHGSVDWVTPFAGVVVGALALAAAGAGLGAAEQPLGRGGRRALTGVLALALVAAVAAGSLAASVKLTERAVETGATDPGRAFADFDTAARLDPLGPVPPLNEGLLALRLRDERRAAAAFAEAVDRNPGAWFPNAMLGVLRARAGDRGAAADHLDRAVSANPRDAGLRDLRKNVRRGGNPDALESARTFVE